MDGGTVGAGHCANLDRPEETNALIMGFVQRRVLVEN